MIDLRILDPVPWYKDDDVWIIIAKLGAVVGILLISALVGIIPILS